MMAVPPGRGNAESLRDLLPFGRTHRIARLLTSVVNTYALKLIPPPAGSPPGTRPRREGFFASGFIIDPSGIIVTNEHVVDHAVDITVTLSDGTTLPAELVGTGDGAIDIAVLKVSTPRKLPAVLWGDSNEVRVGDQVLAIGNPLGVGESITEGIVSAKNRDIMDSPFDDFIQTDAAINHGNSGGPLFNMAGRIIGVDTALETPNARGGSVGVGFAIPGNDARAAVEDLLRYGRLRLGWIGLRAQDLTPDIADAVAAPVPYGAIVVQVDPDAPAAEAGIEVGDVILRFGRQTVRDSRALARAVAATTIGTEVPVAISRIGQHLERVMKIAAWPKEQGIAVKGDRAGIPLLDAPNLGLQLAMLSNAERTHYKIPPEQKGVLIVGVAAGTAADAAGLSPGEVIVQVQQTPVNEPGQVQALLNDAQGGRRRHLVILVRDHSDLRWVSLLAAREDR
jgi:serine protease Do